MSWSDEIEFHELRSDRLHVVEYSQLSRHFQARTRVIRELNSKTFL